MSYRPSLRRSLCVVALSLALTFPSPARADTKGRDVVMFTAAVVSVTFLGVLIYKAIVSEPSKPKEPPVEPTPTPTPVEGKAGSEPAPSDPSTESSLANQIEPTHSEDLINHP